MNNINDFYTEGMRKCDLEEMLDDKLKLILQDLIYEGIIKEDEKGELWNN